MDCQEVQEEILDSLEDASSTGKQQELEAHLAKCPSCAAFASKQKALDVRLSQLFTPPEISRAFRPALNKRIHRETARLWLEALPDIVHFASCGAATALCAVLLPYSASYVFSVGISAAVLAYVPLIAIRSLFAHETE